MNSEILPAPTDQSAYDQLVTYVSERNNETMTKEQREKRDRQKTRVLPIDPSVRARGIRYLLRFVAGEKPSKILKEEDMSWGEVSLCRLASVEYREVMEWAQAERREIMAAKAEARLEMMLDGELDEKTGAARAVMFALERLKRGQFARDALSGASDPASDQAKGSPQVVYNITIQQANSATAVQPPVIDVTQSARKMVK